MGCIHGVLCGVYPWSAVWGVSMECCVGCIQGVLWGGGGGYIHGVLCGVVSRECCVGCGVPDVVAILQYA